MENLVCDLKNALDLNIRINTRRNFSKITKSTSSKNKFYRHHSSAHHNQKSNLECCKLTKSIVSQAVLSSSSLNNLVRMKTTNSNSKLERSKLYVKTKTPRKIYKIQKTFRFRNYRLRCIRLRRESRQQYWNKNNKSLYPPQATINFNFNHSSKSFVINKPVVEEDDAGTISSSSVDSSDNSNPSVTSNSFVTTSISSASDNELSLTEYFKSTKFLNSSDPSKEDEDDEETKGRKSFEKFIGNKKLKKFKSNSTLTRKSSHKFSRSSAKTNSGRVAVKANANYFSKMSIGLLSKTEQVVNGAALKRKRHRDEDEEEILGSCFKQSFTNLNAKTRFEVTKKLRLKTNNSHKVVSAGSSNQTLLKCLKKNNKCLRSSKTDDTSEKETDEDNTKVFSDVKKSSNRKSSNKHGNRDGLEADDEQSDWPSYEKTPGHQQRASKKMETELSEAFSVVPWWEKDGVDLIRKQSYYDTCLQNSNYEIMNRSEDAEKTKEFDEILNGALGLMSSKAKDIYHTKMKSITSSNGKYRSRSNSLATGSMKLATKSATNLDSFFKNENVQDLEKAPAITESNKGYKLLQKMGWQPGFGSEPIVAIMRPKKQGFGYGQKETS